MRASRRRLLLIAAASFVTAALAACSSDEKSSGPTPTPTGGADVIVTATFDGATASVVRVGDDDNGPVTRAPYPGQPGLSWTLDDASGAVLATGTVEDVTEARVEFAADGTAAPFDGHGTGFFEIRVPYVAGSTLTVVPVAGGSSGQPATHSLRPQGICATPPCTSSAPITAPTPAAPASGVPGLKKIIDHGACTPFNIMLVSEGYKSSEMSSFEAAAQMVASGFSGYNGYSAAIQDFNFWSLEVASVDSGINDPGCVAPGGGNNDPCPTTIPPAHRDTAFGTTYSDNVTEPRRLITFGTGHADAQATLASAMRAARADSVGMLANDPANLDQNYGGSGGRPWITAVQGSSYGSVATHESGHSLFGLQDEYDYGDSDSTCASEAMSGTSAGRGPFPLVNVSNSASSPSWKSVQSAAPIEGAYYCTHGWYRPETTCLMKDLTGANGHNNFCSVCLDHVNSTVKAKEAFASCSCGMGDAGTDAAASDSGGTLVTGMGPLVCPTGSALVQQATSAGWYPF